MTFHSLLLCSDYQPSLAMRVQRPAVSQADELYVHGSTFGADLSLFHALDGRSWADALNDAGFTAWAWTSPVTAAPTATPSTAAARRGGWKRYCLNCCAPYKPQVFSEVHFQAWGEAFLATDPQAWSRMPPSVSTPTGPQWDVQALWSGQPLYDPSRITAPTLLSAMGSPMRDSAVVGRATHLMHLEAQRGQLYNAVNNFLNRSVQ